LVVSKIQHFLTAYKDWLNSIKHHPRAYQWESVQLFQNHWNLDTADPAEMYQQCLQNSETRRMWQEDNWHPKKMMYEFWRFDPMTLRLMFEDLFNETKTVDGRIGRFLFGCDTVLRDYKKAKATTVENNHYHDDYQMIAIYLAFRYPETYSTYDFPAFQSAMTHLGARDIPQQHDLPRYFKVVKTLTTFLDKDPEIEKRMQVLLQDKRFYKGKSALLAGDFIRFVSSFSPK
jgi:hypothetical protein